MQDLECISFCLVWLQSSYLPERMYLTSKNNKNYIEKRLTESISQMEEYIRVYPDFPVPAHYAHPIVLKRMQEIMERRGVREIFRKHCRF